MALFWELHQHMKIHEARKEADRAYYSAKNVGLEVSDLKGKCDKALLVCEALWSFINERLGVTEDELIDRIKEIDLSDGKMDGKARRTVMECPHCNRTISMRYQRCIYCGEVVEHDPFAV
jgi:hypothetical protein